MPIAAEFRHHYKTEQWFRARRWARARARDRCERCNFPNGAWVVVVGGKRVEVMARDAEAAKVLGKRVVLIRCGGCHVNNIPGDDRPDNVRWWCRGCHLAFDARHHRRTRQARKDRARPLLEEAS